MDWWIKIITQMQNLLSLINEKTGAEDTTLVDAINRLIKGYVYSIETAANVNHVLKAFIATSSVENDNMNFIGSNVGDGDYDTRWASKYPSIYNEAQGFDTNPWIKIRFDKLTLIKQINIILFNRNTNPIPSNVSQLSIKYTDMNDNVGYIIQDYKNPTIQTGYSNDITIILKDSMIVKEIELCEFVVQTENWHNVGIVEIEAYSNEQ